MTTTMGRAPHAGSITARPVARDASVLAAGSAVAIVTAYLLLLTITRRLGDEAAAPISLLWSYWLFATAAIGVPLQQWMVRSAAAGVSARTQRDTLTVAVAAAMALTVVVFGAGLAAGDRLFSDDRAEYSLCLAGITIGAVALGYARGRLGAGGRYGWVAATLAGENTLRLVVAVPLLILGAGARSMGGVLVLGAAIALLVPLVPVERPAGSAPGPGLTLLASLSVVAVLPQVLFAAVPYVLALRAAPQSVITAAFVLLAVLRIPNVVTNAIGLRVLDFATEMTATDPERLRRHRAMIARVVPVAAGAVALGAAVVVVPIVGALFGLEQSLPSVDVAFLAAGAILAVGVTLLIILMAAAGDVRQVVLAGGAAIACGAGFVLVLADPVRATTVGFAAAELTFFVGCLLPIRRGVTSSSLSEARS